LLAADRAARAAGAGVSGPLLPVLALVALGLGGGVGLYFRLGAPGYDDLPRAARIEAAAKAKAERPAQDVLEARMGVWTPAPGTDPKFLDLIGQLRQAMAAGSTDPAGWTLLAHNEEMLGNFAAAWRAQARLIELKAKPEAADYARLAALMVSAAGGDVSPEAETALVNALKLDTENRDARFYAGLLYLQTGRPDRAFQFWAPLLNEPGDEPWVEFVRGDILTLARMAGDNRYQPPGPMAGGGAPGVKGPSAADMEAAGEMSPEDRQAFIRSMVEGLADELANQGGPAEKWAQLIRALGVLGETERARAIWQEAQGKFGADPAGLATIRAAAEAAGVAG